jgi:hypothetical protein
VTQLKTLEDFFTLLKMRHDAAEQDMSHGERIAHSLPSARIMSFKDLLKELKRSMDSGEHTWIICRSNDKSSSDYTSLLEDSGLAAQAGEDFYNYSMFTEVSKKDVYGRDTAVGTAVRKAGALVAKGHELHSYDTRILCWSHASNCWVAVGTIDFVHIQSGTKYQLGRRAKYFMRTGPNEAMGSTQMSAFLDRFEKDNGFTKIHLSSVANNMRVDMS